MNYLGSILVAGALVSGAGSASAQVTLGSYTFDSSKFGNTLAQSDGGTFASTNWLNIVNANPGSPGYLTGANFNTGIANIGLGGTPTYTIGYSSAIVNGTGTDLGVVTARFSTNDSITLSVSTDGTTFSAPLVFAPSAAFGTGQMMNYYYDGTGTYSAELFVTPVDLSAFGLASGASIVAARITGAPELDLIRVAGFGTAMAGAVPEPATWAMMIAGFGMAGAALRRRRVTARVAFA